MYVIVFLVTLCVVFCLTVFGIRTLYRKTMTKQATGNYQKYLDISEKENGKRFLYRDSLLVETYMKTVFDSLDLGLQYQVQDIIYSPDSLKMISFICYCKQMNANSSESTWSAVVLRGVRNTKYELWKLFELKYYIPDKNSNKFDTQKDRFLFDYFSYHIRKSSVKVFNDKLKYAGKVRKETDTYRVISNQYCLPDPRFWDDLTFIKDNKMKGLYDFQVKKIDGKYKEDTQDWFIVPDSISEMYNNEN